MTQLSAATIGGAHSSVPPLEPAEELPAPVWETIEWDDPVSLFD